MAFKNRIRLPFKITRPQFPETRVNFRKANGETKTLSVVIRKEYEGETDFMPEGWHEKLKIAFGHDNIRIEGDKYLGDIAQTGEYTIEWPDFLDYPTAKAKFKADVTPFAETNSNCMSCEEATQLQLTDDTITGIYGALQEGESYEWNVAENDNICCYPAIFSMIWFNTDYFTAFSIDPATGIVSITLGTDLVSVNGLKIGTYRVTCPNGGYDEADIFADVEGVIEGCLAPTDLQVVSRTPTGITFSWVEPFNDATYYYEVYTGSLPVGIPLYTGLIDISESVTVVGLDPGTEYYFQIRTVCYGANSNFIGVATSTPMEGDMCGEYTVAVDDGTGDPSNSYNCRYWNCAGNPVNVIIFNGNSAIVCALQTAPGSPVVLICPNSVITYNGLC